MHTKNWEIYNLIFWLRLKILITPSSVWASSLLTKISRDDLTHTSTEEMSLLFGQHWKDFHQCSKCPNCRGPVVWSCFIVFPNLNIWQDSPDSTDYTHISLLFRGKRHCAAEKQKTDKHQRPEGLSPAWTPCGLNLWGTWSWLCLWLLFYFYYLLYYLYSILSSVQ